MRRSDISDQPILWFNEWPGDEEDDSFVAKAFVKLPTLTADERNEFLIDLSFDHEVAEKMLKYGKGVK